MKFSCKLLAASALSLILAMLVQAQGQRKSVTVLKTDNSIITGEMVSLNEKRVVLRQANGTEISVTIDEIYELIFGGPNPEQKPSSVVPATTPATTGVDPDAFGRSVSAFRRILSAVEIGVTYISYRQELLETKLQLDQAMAALPESEQRRDLLEAMTDLRWAADAWQIGIENDGIPTKSDFYRSLNARYAFGVNPRLGLKVSYSAALKIIWAKAASRLDHAISLQP